MGTETDTKGSSPSEINPLEKFNPNETANTIAETPGEQDEDSGKNLDDITPENEAGGDDRAPEETEPSTADPEKEKGKNDFVALMDDDVGTDTDNKPQEEALPAETADAKADKAGNENKITIRETKPPDEIKGTAT